MDLPLPGQAQVSCKRVDWRQRAARRADYPVRLWSSAPQSFHTVWINLEHTFENGQKSKRFFTDVTRVDSAADVSYKRSYSYDEESK